MDTYGYGSHKSHTVANYVTLHQTRPHESYIDIKPITQMRLEIRSIRLLVFERHSEIHHQNTVFQVILEVNQLGYRKTSFLIKLDFDHTIESGVNTKMLLWETNKATVIS